MMYRTRSYFQHTGLVLALFVALTVSKSRRVTSSQLVGRAYYHNGDPNPDGFTPHPSPQQLLFMGDSYTAGPGAGGRSIVGSVETREKNCYRSQLAYPNILSGTGPYGLPVLTGSGNLETFIACTGDTTQDVLDNQLEEIPDDQPADIVVLSLGGNDIGFSKIIKACIVKPAGDLSDDCDATLAASRQIMNSAAFRNNMYAVYDGIFKTLPQRNPADPEDDRYTRYQVYHVMYERFFNDDVTSTWCNTKSMSLWPTYKVYLNIPLRQKLNKFVDDLNAALSEIIQVYVMKKMPYQANAVPTWKYNRLFEIRPDYYGTFNGHRFCEPGQEDPQFELDSIWFFGLWGVQPDQVGTPPSDKLAVSTNTDTTTAPTNTDPDTCLTDSRYASDDAFAWDCDVARYLATPAAQKNLTSRDTQPQPRAILGEDWIKAFHPKSAGHQALADEIGKTILWARPGANPGECVGIPAGPADDSGPLRRRDQFTIVQPSTICMLSSSGTTATSTSGSHTGTAASGNSGSHTGTAASGNSGSQTGTAASSTYALPSTVAPVESPATASPTCAPSPTGTTRDSHESYLEKATFYFCSNNGSQTEYLESSVNLKMRIVAGTWDIGKQIFTGAKPYVGNTPEDDVYDISIVSVNGCTPEATTGTFSVGYNLAQPVRDATVTCNTLTYDAWKNCNNKGRGGSILAGCLIYSVKTVY